MSDLALTVQKLLAKESTMNSKIIYVFINLEIKSGIAKSIESAKKEFGISNFCLSGKKKHKQKDMKKAICFALKALKEPIQLTGKTNMVVATETNVGESMNKADKQNT
eukprot:3433992-Ditylum_brightwellii.AAC.1